MVALLMEVEVTVKVVVVVARTVKTTRPFLSSSSSSCPLNNSTGSLEGGKKEGKGRREGAGIHYEMENNVSGEEEHK